MDGRAPCNILLWHISSQHPVQVDGRGSSLETLTLNTDSCFYLRRKGFPSRRVVYSFALHFLCSRRFEGISLHGGSGGSFVAFFPAPQTSIISWIDTFRGNSRLSGTERLPEMSYPSLSCLHDVACRTIFLLSLPQLQSPPATRHFGCLPHRHKSVSLPRWAKLSRQRFRKSPGSLFWCPLTCLGTDCWRFSHYFVP